MKYEVVFYRNEQDNILYKTNDFYDAISIVKFFARKYKLNPCQTETKNCIILYTKYEESKIVEAIGIIEH